MEEIVKALGIDGKLILTQFLGLILLILFLNKFVFKNVFAFLDQRQADIRATYDQMDLDRKRMEDSRLEYQNRLAGIEAEAREKIQASIKEGQTLRDNIVADAQKQVEAILEKGRNDSERERQKAFLEMRQEIVAIAVAAAGKVVGESLNDARHTKLVDDFIGSVGSGAVVEATRGVSSTSISNGNGAQRGSVV